MEIYKEKFKNKNWGYLQLSMRKVIGIGHKVNPQYARLQLVVMLQQTVGSNVRMANLE